MGLNIKNPRTEQLARELAELTGESITAAITEAIQEKIERMKLEKSDLVARWDAITAATAHLWREPYRSMDHGDLLYDEKGLPT